MAVKVINVRCDACNGVSELFTEHGGTNRIFECPRCLVGPATEIPSAPAFHLEGISGAFPTAADKWAVDHERAAKRGPQ